MSSNLSHFEYQTGLTLFEAWLQSPACNVTTKPALGEAARGFEAQLNRPINLTFLGPDAAAVRRFVGLWSGAEEQIAKYATGDVRPVTLRNSADAGTFLRWWDRQETDAFDGSLETANTSGADVISLRGNFGLPADLRLVDLSTAADATDGHLTTFALNRLCDHLVWIGPRDQWKDASKSVLIKAIPAKLRASAVAVLTTEGGSEDTSDVSSYKMAAVAPQSVDLTAASTAYDTGHDALWSASGVEPAMAMILEQIEATRQARVAELAPGIDKLITPYVAPSFWDAVKAKAARLQQMEAATQQAAAAEAAPKSDPVEVAEPAPAASAPVDTAPVETAPEDSVAPDAAQIETAQTETTEPQPTEPEPVEVEVTVVSPPQPIEVSADQPKGVATLRSLWCNEVKTLCADGKPLTSDAISTWLVNTSEFFEMMVDLPEPVRTDCQSIRAILPAINEETEEDAALTLCSILCQLANTIGEVTSGSELTLPSEVERMLSQNAAA